MRTDVLIVGFGLAGWAMTESLQKANKSFVVIDNAPMHHRAPEQQREFITQRYSKDLGLSTVHKN